MTDETETTSDAAEPEQAPSADDAYMKDFEAAIELYNAALNDPDSLTPSINCCRELIQTYPSSAEPYFLLALIAYRCGDEGQAIAMCETAHKMAPDTREYAEALSVIQTSVGHLADGLYYAKLVPALEPHPFLGEMMPARLKDLQAAFEFASPSGHYVEALRLFNLADYARVLKECSSELRLNPRHVQAYILLARTLMIVGSYGQATNALHAAIQIEPEAPLPRAMLARALTRLGEFTEARAVAETALRMGEPEADVETYAQAMDALLTCPDYPLERAKALAESFQRAFDEENEPDDPPALPVDNDRPAHVGLLSNAFFTSDHSELFLSWFSTKRTASTVFFGYQQSVLSDAVATQAKGVCERWREIYDIDPFTFSLTARADELDVFVDLSGPDMLSRMDIAALRPAGTRVATFGLPEPGFAPGTTHVLCDDVLAGASDGSLLPGQEKLVVNGTLFAHAPYVALKNDFESPALRNGFVTFGGVSDLGRLTPAAAAMWSEVLHGVPGSKLLLCGAEHASDRIRNRVLEYFSRHGVVDRLVFGEADQSADPSIEFIEARIPNPHWSEIDIFLDTAPVNCRAETIEALWTGAPVVTLKSNRRAGLVGSSILSAARRITWIAENPRNFVEIATDLAQNTEKLASERDRLQKNVPGSTLFDPEGLAVEIRRTLTDLAMTSRKAAAAPE